MNLDQLVLPRYSSSGSGTDPVELVELGFSWAICPFCHPAIIVKALNSYRLA